MMAAQFKVETQHYGTLRIFAIRQNPDGTWEPEWEPLRQSGMEEVLDLLSPISYIAYSELRARYAKPFMDEAGLPPKACILKLTEETSLCVFRDTCPTYGPECSAKTNPPVCYDPSVEDLEIRPLVARLISLWRLGFYTILVTYE